MLYCLGLVFLAYDVYYDLIQMDYWSLFVNVLFVVMVIYMVFVYPKRKLYLTEDMMIFLFIYFSVLWFKSLWVKDAIKVIISSIYITGFIAYKVYQKKTKYRFYLKR